LVVDGEVPLTIGVTVTHARRDENRVSHSRQKRVSAVAGRTDNV
jgi:hypothetical protein